MEPRSRFRAATEEERAQVRVVLPLGTGYLPAVDPYGHLEPATYTRAVGTTQVVEQAPSDHQRKHIKYSIRGNELCMEEEEEESPPMLHPMPRISFDHTQLDEPGVWHTEGNEITWQATETLANLLTDAGREVLEARIQENLARFVGEPNNEQTRTTLEEQICHTIRTFLAEAAR